VVSRRVTGSTATVSATVLQAARSWSDRLARQQRQYAHVDRSIEPETFDPSPVLLKKTG
jgi:hypothetical protein